MSPERDWSAYASCFLLCRFLGVNECSDDRKVDDQNEKHFLLCPMHFYFHKLRFQVLLEVATNGIAPIP